MPKVHDPEGLYDFIFGINHVFAYGKASYEDQFKTLHDEHPDWAAAQAYGAASTFLLNH